MNGKKKIGILLEGNCYIIYEHFGVFLVTLLKLKETSTYRPSLSLLFRMSLLHCTFVVFLPFHLFFGKLCLET